MLFSLTASYRFISYRQPTFQLRRQKKKYLLQIYNNDEDDDNRNNNSNNNNRQRCCKTYACKVLWKRRNHGVLITDLEFA